VLARRPGHRRRSASLPVQPRPQVELDRLVDASGVEQRVLGLVEGVQRGRALEPGQRRRDEDEGADPLGVREREVDRHPAAERVPDHRRALDAELVEKRPGVLHERERPCRERGGAEAAQVRAHDQAARRKRLELAVPQPPVANARVQEQQRGPAARSVVGDLGAVDPRRAQLLWA
jgi:hypothetical protein